MSWWDQEWGKAYPSRLDVSMKQRPSGSDEEMRTRSAGMNSSDSTRTTSPTQMSFHLRPSKEEDEESTLAMRALSSESDWCRFWKRMRAGQGKRGETDEVFLALLESGHEEDGGEWGDGRVLICGGDVWYLLDARGKEEEYVCVFGELLCGGVSARRCDVAGGYP